MTKFECRSCLEYFDFKTATKIAGTWFTTCPSCNQLTAIDIEDYLVPIGTTVRLINHEAGTVTGYVADAATDFDSIIYIIDRGTGKSDCHAKRNCFTIEDTWKKLRRIPGGGIDRVCHYTRNQDYSNVPCYNCVDRTKCNADIFETLALYEDSDMKPEEVMAFKSFHEQLIRANLTLEQAIDILTRNHG